MGAPEGMDWSWAVATGGTLGRRERRALLTPLLRTAVGYATTRVRLVTGRRGAGGVDVDRLRWPDSKLALAAEEEARDSCSPDVLAHCYRSYLFGLSLAAIDGFGVDEELCYVICLLHDLAVGKPTPGRCFAVVGGERAERFALDHGEPADRASTIGSAIGGHLTAGQDQDLSHPGGFVSAGAFLDVSGSRIDELDPGWVDGLLNRYPRQDFKRRLNGYLAEEAAAMPAGRTGYLTRIGRLPLLVRIAPFPE